MKGRLLILFLAGGILHSTMAQVPQGTHISGNFSTVSYRETPEGKKLDFVINGSSVSNLTSHNVLVNDFELKSFKNGDAKVIQIIAQAPLCQVDLASNIASDRGPLQIFTPTTNLFVQGVGFLFTQSNHFLVLSNQVYTRVVKSMLKTSILTAPHPDAATDTNQIIKIFADYGQFQFDSNVVDYAGHVHTIDPQLDMTSDFLTIRFDTNGTLQSILARQNVVLTTTNNGRATGEMGLYYITNNDEMMRLTTNATWHNGDEDAKAEMFTYDSNRHFLTGIGHVRAEWPNTAGMGAHPATPTVGTNGYRKLWADYATLQFPPTNGPVERMTARGNVIIVNQADHSSSLSDQAVYVRATGKVDLTGHPAWRNGDTEVKAETLSADLNDQVYYARKNAHFKMRSGGGPTPVPATQPTAPPSGKAADQWIFISSDNIEYRTNLAIFSGDAQSRLTQDGKLRDALNCDVLTLLLVSNQVDSAFAAGNVQGETAPDLSGVIKTIACDQLNAYRSVKTGLMKSIDAHTNVVIQQYGISPASPHNQLTADTVTAQFSPVTNQIEQAVALKNVVFDQVKAGQTTHATADRAVYTAASDLVKLTGNPVAHTANSLITNADFIAWHPNLNQLNAVGLYKILPFKTAAAQISK